MKKFLSLFLLFAILITISPSFASSKHHTPLRYTNRERNIKHAGTIRKSYNKSNIMNLNYKTGAGATYKTGALCNYNTSSGLNYNTGTNLIYR